MSHDPRTLFVVKRQTRVIIPKGLPRSATAFGFITRVDGQSFHFLWQWSGKYGKYDLQVVRQDDVRVLSRTVYTDDPGVPIRNWNLNAPDRPDAVVTLIDITGERNPLLPHDLGNTHHLFIFTGEVVKV